VKRTASLVASAVAVPLFATSVAAMAPNSPALPNSAVATTVTASAPTIQIAGDTDFSSAAAWAKQAEIRDRKRAARNGGLRTYGTANTAEQAVARLKQWANQGMAGYPNQCLRLTDDAFGASNRTTTALAQWARAKQAGVAHPDSRDIPVGAQMFWRTSHPAGHIATYVGDGKVVTNMPGGSVEIVNWHELNEWGPYLGWANPYYG
jgi:hypothetical protein